MSSSRHLTASEKSERARKALELHLAGATYQKICDALGYASTQTAWQDVQDGLATLGEHNDPDTQRVALARLDAMLQGLWPAARRGDVAAVDRVLRIEAQRHSLLGAIAVTSAMSGNAAPEKEATGLDELAQRRAQRASG